MESFLENNFENLDDLTYMPSISTAQATTFNEYDPLGCANAAAEAAATFDSEKSPPQLRRSKRNVNKSPIEIEQPKQMAEDNSINVVSCPKRKNTDIDNDCPKTATARERAHDAMESYEVTEARRMRMRINNIKVRLLAKLKLSETKLAEKRKAEAQRLRERRAKKRETETPEEAAARKRHECEQKAWMRKRKEAAETPEETASRKTKERLEARKFRVKRLATETTEQKKERLQRQRAYQQAYKLKKLTAKAVETSNTNTAKEIRTISATNEGATEEILPAITAALKVVKFAHETIEQKMARKERERAYRANTKRRKQKLQISTGKATGSEIVATTDTDALPVAHAITAATTVGNAE